MSEPLPDAVNRWLENQFTCAAPPVGESLTPEKLFEVFSELWKAKLDCEHNEALLEMLLMRPDVIAALRQRLPRCDPSTYLAMTQFALPMYAVEDLGVIVGVDGRLLACNARKLSELFNYPPRVKFFPRQGVPDYRMMSDVPDPPKRT